MGDWLKGKSVVDYGSGSGVLGILTLMLGAEKVRQDRRAR
jgi:ribosomal protein L11 methylase PrmA